jgi:hypothetical protein
VVTSRFQISTCGSLFGIANNKEVVRGPSPLRFAEGVG